MLSRLMNNDHVHQVYYGEEGGDATRLLTRARIHWIVDQVPDGRILDLGCSQGVTSVLLAERGATVVGADIEAPAIEFAQKVREGLDAETQERLQFVEADGAEIPFALKSFDHVVCSEVLEHAENPNKVVEEMYRVLKPGGLLVVTVPFGVMPHPDHKRVFYPDSLAALLEPMFIAQEQTLLERHIAFVGKRRAKAKGSPSYSLGEAESAYLEHEEELRGGVEDVRAKLNEANSKYRNATTAGGEYRDRLAKAQQALSGAEEQSRKAGKTAATLKRELEGREEQLELLRERSEKQRAELETASGELERSREEAGKLKSRITELEGKVEAGRDQLEAAMAELKAGKGTERRRLRERRELRRSRTGEQLDHLHGLTGRQKQALDRIEAGLPDIREHLEQTEAIARRAKHGEMPSPSIPRPSRPREADEFDRWCERAAAAPGDEVVFMYSGTIHVQEKRGNRPIRLTRVYLDQERPVFFNYWRWNEDEPPPDYSHPLLFQSPVDITPKLLDRLLEADFGGKRKMMFASFPHELMIRSLSRGAQHGWVTIYDARDDWEEFEKVGMAKWYDLGFEEYLVRHADVVTAVSAPLARKLGEMGNRHDIEVVPNALDSGFPEPPGPREVADPPVVGYFGHLTAKWFDWDLIIRAAREHPDWSFELAGHQEPEDLELPENVSLLGLLGHAELASLSRRWSFAIIPFKVSALGEAVDPIKVYEYLHLGLPVLSSYIPQMRDYPATVIAESSEDFLALLPAMAQMTLDAEKVRPWLEVNRWEDRVDQFSRLAERAQRRNRSSRSLRSLLPRAPHEAAPAPSQAVKAELGG